MRPLLTLPPDWKPIVQPSQTVYLAPGDGMTVLIAAGVLVPQSPDEQARSRAVLGIELDGHQLRPAATVLGHTDAGWPMELTPALVLSGERVVEQRLLALYRFAEWRAHILVRGFREEAWQQHTPTIRSALASARPGWRTDGEVYCIAHLYEA